MKRLMLVMLLSLCLVASVAAQDAEVTPEPQPIIVEDGGTVIVEAPDETPTDVVPTNVVVIVLTIVGTVFLLAFVVYAYSQGKSAEMLWKSFPRPVQDVGRTGLELALGQAYLTEETLDEEALTRLAEALGYVVARLEDGRVILTPKPPPAPEPIPAAF